MHAYCPIIFASCVCETRAFMRGSFSSSAGCPLLALLLQSASAADELLLEDVRFASGDLRPLIRTRSDAAARAFFPNMRAAEITDEEGTAATAGEGEEEGRGAGGERQELGGLLEVVMTQDEKDRGKKANGEGK